MQTIRWVGASPNWARVPPSVDPAFIFPLTEESVLDVAALESDLPKLSMAAAIACTSRMAQRTLLEIGCPELNPRWVPYFWEPIVFKAPASVQNEGVRFFHEIEMLDLLKKHNPRLAQFGVQEEFIYGVAYEVDGVVFGDRDFRFFHPVQQNWRPSYDKIASYHRVYDDYLIAAIQDVARRVVTALRITNAPFCVELRQLPDGSWRVIEAQARLGEDDGSYFQQIWDWDILAQVNDWAIDWLMRDCA